MADASPMQDVAVGQVASVDATVDGRLLTSFWGKAEMEVLATPSLVHLVELAASRAIDPRLAEGYTTVGLSVAIDHMAASPKGAVVTLEAKVTDIDGRKVTFDVEAREAEKVVARSTHTRFVVNEKRFAERLAQSGV